MSFLRLERPIAINATCTPSTRLPNTRREKKARPLKEEDVMTENNLVMEVKPNLFSEKKLKQPRKSPSDCNATLARQEDVLLSAEQRVLFLWISKKSESKELVREMLFINDRFNI